MKKIFAAVALSIMSLSTASAATFFYNGILFGNVCRSGYYYTVYPVSMAQPVGTLCTVRDPYGYPIMTGRVSNE